VTARLEISRLAPTRAEQCDRRPSGSLWPVPGGYTEKVSHSRSGTAMEGGTEPEPQTRPRQRLRGRATSRRDRRRVAKLGPARLPANVAQEGGGKFSCLQTPEISQYREIFLRRRGHEDASR
jgi:hypothetical protein